MESIRQTIADIDPELLLLDSGEHYDRCIIGIASRIGQEDCVAYDTQCVIDVLVEDGLDPEAAQEFFDFNIAGAYVGERTPIFIECLNRTAPLHGGGEGPGLRAAPSADVVTATTKGST
jgi:hypothetical protein